MTSPGDPGPVGRSHRRIEDPPLVTGSGPFTADLVPPDALHAWFVRSPFARGDLLAIDVGTAAAMPGVVDVITATDLDLRDLPARIGGRDHPGMARPMLARDRVTHVGQAVAVVLAERPAQAEDAAGLVFADIDLGEPVLTVAEATGTERLVHPAAGTNVVLHETLAVGPEPVGGLVEVTVAVEHPRLAPSPIEPLAALATPTDDALHLHVGTQAPHRLRDELALVLGLEPDQIRISVPNVGGAFGMKRFHPEYAVIAAAALRLRRPVAWVQPRRDLFVAGSHGRSQRHEVTLCATAEGHIREARFVLTTDTGAYPHVGAQIGQFSRLVATGLYDIPRVEFELIAAVTNLPPTAPYRGAGRPEAALAIERAIDALARRLGIDPAELRRRNLIARLPHVTPTGAKHDSGDYAAALEQALRIAAYEEVRQEQMRRRQAGEDPVGIGLGAFIERAGGAPDSWEYGAVTIDTEGQVVVRTGATSAGQGHATVWRRLIATMFGVEAKAVDLRTGDTAEVPDSVGSFASRSAQIGASAVVRCAEEVRMVAARVAADLLEADPGDLVFVGGAVQVAGVPDAGVTLAQIAAEAQGRQIALYAEERYSPGAQTFPYGVHVAIVEVELETGRVRPLRLVAVDDVGTVLDSMIVTGQVRGSVTQGLGAALYERMRYDELGQPLSTTFMDYLIPSSALDAPLALGHLTHPAPSNPLGAKGAGEGGCIGMPPAIINATLDALEPYGVTELQIPLTADRVWHALNEAAVRGAAP